MPQNRLRHHLPRRLKLLSLATLASVSPLPATADQVHLEVNRFYTFGSPPGIHDDHNATSSTLVGTLSIPYATATVAGNPYSEAGSSITFSAAIPDAPEPATSTTNTAQFELALDSFAYYPTRAGALGELFLSGSTSNAGINYFFRGAFPGSLDGSTTLSVPSKQFILQIGGGILNAQRQGYQGSASVNLRFEPNAALTRRLHWNAQDRGPGLTPPPADASAESNWLERLTPTQDFVAVFGKFSTIQNPKLTSSATWLGVVSDGFGRPELDLDGNTLTLKTANLVEDNFSISIGEEQFGSSSMSVANGTVNGESNLLIQTRTAQQADGTSASFAIRPNTTVNLKGIVSMSKFANTDATLAVVGENAKLNALGLIAGNNGRGLVFIEGGAQVFLEQNFQVARGTTGNNAQVQVVGPGSSLTVGGGNYVGQTFVQIGNFAQGTLAVHDGATAQFNDSQVDIGNPLVSNGSILSVKGANSKLLGGTYNVGTSATLEILDGATLSSHPSAGVSIASNGTFTADNNASVTTGSLFVSGANAKARIANNSHLATSGGEIRIRPTTTLTVVGSSTLSGFDQMLVAGDFLLGGSSVATGNQISLDTTGRIIIAGGAMQVTTLQANHGKIIIDSGAFAQTEPPEDPGGGGDQAAFFASVPDSSTTDTSPCGASLSLTGNLLLGPDASLELHIYSPTDFDTLTITGNAALNGTLLLNFPTYAPQTGDTFTFLNVTGAFTGGTNLLPQGLNPDWQFSASFSNGALQLTSLSNATLAIPEPSALSCFALGLALTRRRRS